MGLESFDPFHSMHYEQSQSAQTKWLDILEGRADDIKSWLQNFQGPFTRAEKTGRHSQFSIHSLGRLPSWFVFVAPQERRVL